MQKVPAVATTFTPQGARPGHAHVVASPASAASPTPLASPSGASDDGASVPPSPDGVPPSSNELQANAMIATESGKATTREDIPKEITAVASAPGQHLGLNQC